MNDSDSPLVLVFEESFRIATRGRMVTTLRKSGRPSPGRDVLLTRVDGFFMSTRILGVEACAPPRSSPEWAAVLLPLDSERYVAVGSVITERPDPDADQVNGSARG